MGPRKLLTPLLALALTSCGRTGEKRPQQASTQISQSEYQTLLSNAASQHAILGDIPESKQDTLPTQVWFKSGNGTHSASELVDLAVERITKEEGGPPYVGARAQVVFCNDGSEILAEVIVGAGVGRPCWTMTFDKGMRIRSYSKGTTAG
jgi:hypothetical protein